MSLVKLTSRPLLWSSIRCASRYFTEKHEWISLAKDQQSGRVGVSEHAQEALGDVVYVQLPEVGANFSQFDEVGAIESVKAASEILAPVSGEVLSINGELAEKPSLINKDCYDAGWLYELKLKDKTELDKLMDEDKYKDFLKTGQ